MGTKVSREISRCLTWATEWMLMPHTKKKKKERNASRKELLGEDEFSFVRCQDIQATIFSDKWLFESETHEGHLGYIDMGITSI